MRAAFLVLGAALLAAGAVAGWLVAGGDLSATTVTETSAPPADRSAAAGLPAAVEQKREAVADAAERRDWDALRTLIAPGFEYTFGSPVEGGAVGFWQRLEREGERPLEALTQVLRLPYTLSRGVYVWPFAYDRTRDELTSHERQLLAPLGQDGAFAEGYLGWRAGIEPDGDWVFFIAGD